MAVIGDKLKKFIGAISLELLGSTNFERVNGQFNLSSADSFFRWDRAAAKDAHVVFIDATSNLLRLKEFTPCVVWVGEDSLGMNERCGWVGRLTPGHTIIEFCYALDCAAIFLLDRRGLYSKPLEEYISFRPSINERRNYRLTLKEKLPKPFDTDKYIRAASILRRQWATAAQIENYSGLSPALVYRLLNELSSRGVLASESAGANNLGNYLRKVNRIWLLTALRIKVLFRSKNRSISGVGRSWQ